jgi:hypothetical protein
MARKNTKTEVVENIDEIEVKLDEASMSSGQKAAYRMGMTHGAKGVKKIDASKSFGPHADYYHRGYEQGYEGEKWREHKSNDRLRNEEVSEEEQEMYELDEGKYDYPKHMTQTRTNSDMGTTNAADNRERRKAFRKKIKAIQHKELMSGKRKQSVEESVASDTLKADSRSDDSNPKSKIAAINSVIGSMNAMSSDELTKWYTSAMALIGKEASSLPGSANSDSNRNSLNMKEDVEEMFVGTDLSEEFKDKAITLFEAAVNARATLEIARLEEEFETAYEQLLEEEVASIVENVETNLDIYLDYVVEKWMEDNQVAVESSLRNEIMEEFIGGLKGLFTEHYIDVPEEKVNVIEAMAQKIETLENALNESINDNNELKSELVEARMLSLVDELSEGLTMSQAEKFAALAEGVSFDGNFNSYKSKLEMVKETYFSMKPKTSNIEEETFESDDESVNTVNMDPHVSNYVRAIARTTKK